MIILDEDDFKCAMKKIHEVDQILKKNINKNHLSLEKLIKKLEKEIYAGMQIHPLLILDILKEIKKILYKENL